MSNVIYLNKKKSNSGELTLSQDAIKEIEEYINYLGVLENLLIKTLNEFKNITISDIAKNNDSHIGKILEERLRLQNKIKKHQSYYNDFKIRAYMIFKLIDLDTGKGIELSSRLCRCKELIKQIEDVFNKLFKQIK